MILGVYGTSGNNKTRLEYTSSAVKPANTPAYIINNDKADEFVAKYNKLNKKTQKVSAGMVLLGALAGVVNSVKRKTKILSSLVKILTGSIAGAFCGACYAYETKNKLMDKYSVKSA